MFSLIPEVIATTFKEYPLISLNRFVTMNQAYSCCLYKCHVDQKDLAKVVYLNFSNDLTKKQMAMLVTRIILA